MKTNLLELKDELARVRIQTGCWIRGLGLELSLRIVEESKTTELGDEDEVVRVRKTKTES